MAAVKYIGFEDLAYGVFSKMRKYITLFDYKELRKATRMWNRLPQGQVILNIRPGEDIFEFGKHSSCTLNFDIVQLRCTYEGPISLTQMQRELYLHIGHKVKYLVIASNLPSVEIRMALNAMPNLEKLRVRRLPISKFDLFGLPADPRRSEMMIDFTARVFQNTYQFTHFRFSGMRNLDSVFAYALAYCEDLVSLSLIYNYEISRIPNLLWIHTIHSMEKIEYLSLAVSDPAVIELFANHLSTSTHLRRLNIWNFYVREDIIEFAYLRWSNTITHLTIGANYTRNADNFTKALRPCKQLSSLTLTWGCWLQLSKVRNNLPAEAKMQLRKLLILCSRHNERGVIELLQELPNLNHLVVKSNDESERVLQTICAHQPKLHYLKSNLKQHFDDLNVFSSIKQLQRLECLILRGVTFRAEIVTQAIDEINQLPELRHLRLNRSYLGALRNVAWKTLELRTYIQSLESND